MEKEENEEKKTELKAEISDDTDDETVKSMEVLPEKKDSDF